MVLESVSLEQSNRLTLTPSLCALQEDLSRLRRKLEKQKKVEVYTDADEILQEEINQYKVRGRVLSGSIP